MHSYERHNSAVLVILGGCVGRLEMMCAMGERRNKNVPGCFVLVIRVV